MYKNIDFLEFTEVSSWTFTVVGKARSASDVSSEILDITKQVLEFNQGFFKPRCMKYLLFTLKRNPSPGDIWNLFKEEHQESIKREIAVGEHPWQDLNKNVNALKVPEDRIMFLRYINIWGKTRFILEGKDVFIDENSSKELFASWNAWDEVIDEERVIDPLDLTVSDSLLKGPNEHLESGDPAHYKIVFWTHVGIWFDRTEIGRANRERLRNVFRKIYDNYQVVDILFVSDRYDEERLKHVVFGQD